MVRVASDLVGFGVVGCKRRRLTLAAGVLATRFLKILCYHHKRTEMMSCSNDHHREKKRKTDGGGGDDGGSTAMADIKSILGAIMEQNRSQMEAMQSKMDAMMDQSRSQIESMQSQMDAILEKLNRSEARNERLEAAVRSMSDRQRYHQVLLKNQHWTYLAPDPPSMELDETGLYRPFMLKMRGATREMRQGIRVDGEASEGVFVLSSADYLYYDGEEFDPHWFEFAGALGEYRYCLRCLPEEKEAKSTLAIRNIELPSNRVLASLSRALRDTHFRRFELTNNMLESGGVDFALGYLESNPILEEFSLVENALGGRHELSRLCDVIRTHPSIKTINLDGCEIDEDGIDILHSILAAAGNKLKVIILSSTGLTTEDGTFLGDFLATNPELHSLNLRNNFLGDDDATMIARALKHNTNLRSLDLGENPLSRHGAEELKRVEFDGASLNSAASSNHTCRIRYPDLRYGYNGACDWKLNRAKKIYSLLSSRNRQCSNTKAFGDVPLEFLPDMLSSIQGYSKYHLGDDSPDEDTSDTKALSVVYEIMRWWDKAISLYELLPGYLRGGRCK